MFWMCSVLQTSNQPSLLCILKKSDGCAGIQSSQETSLVGWGGFRWNHRSLQSNSIGDSYIISPFSVLMIFLEIIEQTWLLMRCFVGCLWSSFLGEASHLLLMDVISCSEPLISHSCGLMIVLFEVLCLLAFELWLLVNVLLFLLLIEKCIKRIQFIEKIIPIHVFSY